MKSSTEQKKKKQGPFECLCLKCSSNRLYSVYIYRSFGIDTVLKYLKILILLYILNIAHTKVILILLALNIDNLLHKSYSSMIFHFSKLIAAIIIDNQVEWYKTYATDEEGQ